MSFSDILTTLRRGWRTLAAVLAIVVLLSVIITTLTPNQYESDISFYVVTRGSSDNSSTNAYQGSLLAQDRVRTYVQLVTSDRVLAEVARSLPPLTVENLKRDVSAATVPDSILFTATVVDESQERATAVANRVGVAVSALISDLERPDTPTGRSDVTVRIVEPATSTNVAVSPNVPRNIAAGVVGGLVIGIAYLISREVLDTTIRSRNTINEITGASTLSESPADPGSSSSLAESSGFDGRSIEPFLRLRTNLSFFEATGSRKAILITSPLPGEGKTTVACNLAIAMARSGRKTLLIDADLRRPRIAPNLNLEGSAGLTSILSGRANFRSVVQSYDKGAHFSVLTSGPVPPNSSELLGSEQMRMLLEWLRQEFDSIVIDSAPLLPVADAAALAPYSDGAVLVCRHSKTKKKDLELAVTSIRTVGAHLLGAHFSAIPLKDGSSSYYGYGYTSSVVSSNSPSATNHRKNAAGKNGDTDTSQAGKPSPSRRASDQR